MLLLLREFRRQKEDFVVRGEILLYYSVHWSKGIKYLFMQNRSGLVLTASCRCVHVLRDTACQRTGRGVKTDRKEGERSRGEKKELQLLIRERGESESVKGNVQYIFFKLWSIAQCLRCLHLFNVKELFLFVCFLQFCILLFPLNLNLSHRLLQQWFPFFSDIVIMLLFLCYSHSLALENTKTWILLGNKFIPIWESWFFFPLYKGIVGFRSDCWGPVISKHIPYQRAGLKDQPWCKAQDNQY